MARILFTSFYQDKSDVRQKELELCVSMNIKNPLIDKIVVMIEGQREHFPILNHEKIQSVEKPRPTYQMFFDLANSMVSENDISMISNTDIFFDETLALVDRIQRHQCFALSRYHYNADHTIKLHHEKFSQDTWIFRGKIRPMKYTSFHLGTRGCDNRIAHEIVQAGYKIMNPAHSIKTIHYHLSDIHNYGVQFVPKPYLPVELCKL